MGSGSFYMRKITIKYIVFGLFEVITNNLIKEKAGLEIEKKCQIAFSLPYSFLESFTG